MTGDWRRHEQQSDAAVQNRRTSCTMDAVTASFRSDSSFSAVIVSSSTRCASTSESSKPSEMVFCVRSAWRLNKRKACAV